MTTTAKGKKGEDKAVSSLRERGYRVIARNYRANGGEVDIVAQKDKLLIFVEVKARAAHTPYKAIEAVTKAKQEKIARAATQFIKEKSPKFDGIRFDVVCVLAEVNIVHVMGAFSPKRTTL